MTAFSIHNNSTDTIFQLEVHTNGHWRLYLDARGGEYIGPNKWIKVRPGEERWHGAFYKSGVRRGGIFAFDTPCSEVLSETVHLVVRALVGDDWVQIGDQVVDIGLYHGRKSVWLSDKECRFYSGSSLLDAISWVDIISSHVPFGLIGRTLGA